MCSYNPVNVTQCCEYKMLKDVHWKEHSFLRTKLVNRKIAHTETKMLTLQSKYGEDLVSNYSIRTLISLITVEVGINVEGGIFWKKLVHKSNKRRVEGGKI